MISSMLWGGLHKDVSSIWSIVDIFWKYFHRLFNTSVYQSIWVTPGRSSRLCSEKPSAFMRTVWLGNGSFWSMISQLNNILFLFLDFVWRLKVILCFFSWIQKSPFSFRQLAEKLGFFSNKSRPGRPFWCYSHIFLKCLLVR